MAIDDLTADRVCNRCGCSKALSLDNYAFHVRRGTFNLICRECNNAANRQRGKTPKAKAIRKAWNDANREWLRAKDASYRKRFPDLVRESRQLWREASREKIVAHSELWTGLKTGAVQRTPCHVCGETTVEGHHPDYSRGRDVVWLCRSHHMQLHWEFKEYADQSLV